MAKIKIVDRVQETTATNGTGTYTLAGASVGYEAFVTGVGTGQSCYYAITDGADWETGIGTLATSTTLARTTIIASSTGSAINWAGSVSKDIFVTISENIFNNFAVSSTAIATPPQATAKGALALGDDTEATSLYSVALGKSSKTTMQNQIAHSHVLRNTAGNQQASVVLGYETTTSATATRVYLDGVGGSVDAVVPASQTWGFVITVVAARTDTGSDSWTNEYRGVIKRNGAGATALVGSIVAGTAVNDAGAAAWSAAVTADDTNEALVVTVTGQASATINWIVKYDMVQQSWS